MEAWQEFRSLVGVRYGAVKSVEGTLRSERTILRNGYPGKEIVIDTPRGYTIKSRLYLVKQRLYQVLAVTEKRKESSKDVEKFLDSFKLLAK